MADIEAVLSMSWSGRFLGPVSSSCMRLWEQASIKVTLLSIQYQNTSLATHEVRPKVHSQDNTIRMFLFYF